jgi:sigma-54 dependent transcriptional regulator, acetoin dehydrogenase operon transcriptional activator AcoR
MPGPLQALLLRVLEDGTYYRVGDNLPRHADIRLVCATCRDLPRMVEEGAFRQDLFYRIDGAGLTLPPLRERSDLPELTMHLLACLTEEDGGRQSSARLDPEAFAWLIAQPWPGNVRQLKTALQHALVLAGGGEIRREHLPVLVGGLPRSAGVRTAVPPPETRVAPPAPPPASPELPPTARSLDELEAEIVRQAVEQAGGNLSLAARRLGIARTTLYRRLRREEG